LLAALAGPGAQAATAQSGLSVGDVIVGEADGHANVVVTLQPASSSTVTVSYATADSTASRFGDYVSASGTLTFAPGQTSQVVPVTIGNDAGVENMESFTLGLSSPVNAFLARAFGRVSIVDNDTVVATPGLFVRDVTVDEQARSVTVPVLLGGPRGQA